jgi:hypothetical protein
VDRKDWATAEDLIRALKKVPPGAVPTYWGSPIAKADIRKPIVYDGMESRGRIAVAEQGAVPKGREVFPVVDLKGDGC